MVALTFYATIFQSSPVGLPVPDDYQTDAPVSPELAAILQDTVWDIVTTTPLSGVNASQPLSVSTAAVPEAIADQAYNLTLNAVGGSGNYEWAIDAGALPTGLTLSNTGVLSGAPTEVGEFTFTVQVTDSDNTQSTQQLTLISVLDTIPQITTTTIPEGARGSFYQQALTASDGNGSLSWQVVSGSLPDGMTLRPDGVLVGTPGLEGTYTFEVQVTDTDATPDSQTQSLTLTVGAPEANTLLIANTQTPIWVNGVLDDGVWTLANVATNAPNGSDGDVLRFGALWDDIYLYVAAEVQDDALQNDSTDPLQDDALQILIDAQHDREVVFNNDDRQFVIGIDGSLFEPSGRTAGVQQAVQTTADGYVVEVAIPWSNLGLTPQANLTIGFDVVQSDDDDGGAGDRSLIWQNTDPANLAPAQFGNLLLSSDTVVSDNPPVQFLATYQAEDATYSGPLLFTGRGAEGDAYLDYTNATGDFIEWRVTVPVGGTYEVSWRYANGSNNRPLALSVNGTSLETGLDFGLTGGWDVWGTVTQTVALQAGENTVRLTATGSSGANFDSMQVRAVSTDPVDPPEEPTPPTPPTLTLSDASATEGSDAFLVFDLSLSEASAEAITLDLAAVDGTAIGGTANPFGAGVDFANDGMDVSTDGGTTWVAAANGTEVTFAAGQTALQVRVAVNDDAEEESATPETLTLAVTNVLGGSVANPGATGTGQIFDNDALAPFDQVYQAEDATYAGPLLFTGRGAEGDAYLDYQTPAGDFIEWTVDVVMAGSYDLAWRYANGSGNRPLSLAVNGDIVDASLDFGLTGGWDVWDMVQQTVALQAGSNTIRLTAVGSSGANFDSMQVVSAGV